VLLKVIKEITYKFYERSAVTIAISCTVLKGQRLMVGNREYFYTAPVLGSCRNFDQFSSEIKERYERILTI